jgi:anaerobic selenocysteine-containing dehydrogenase
VSRSTVSAPLFQMNQEDGGFDCPGCAWPDDQLWVREFYSNDDRYRGLKGLRTVIFMNENDMRDRGLDEFDPVDITSTSKDGGTRTAYGYRVVRFEIPRGCAAGYMPELNVLCGIADYSTVSEQPVTKHLVVEITSPHGS